MIHNCETAYLPDSQLLRWNSQQVAGDAQEGTREVIRADVPADVLQREEGCAWRVACQVADLHDEMICVPPRIAGSEGNGAERRGMHCLLQLLKYHLHIRGAMLWRIMQ